MGDFSPPSDYESFQARIQAHTRPSTPTCWTHWSMHLLPQHHPWRLRCPFSLELHTQLQFLKGVWAYLSSQIPFHACSSALQHHPNSEFLPAACMERGDLVSSQQYTLCSNSLFTQDQKRKTKTQAHTIPWRVSASKRVVRKLPLTEALERN